jgi:hypothetical protein
MWAESIGVLSCRIEGMILRLGIETVEAGDHRTVNIGKE